MKRMKFFIITISILASLFLGLYIYARYIESNLLIVNQINLESPKVDNHLKIVFFGDTHLGEFAGTNRLNQIVEKINAENPDLVIFTGDLIDANKKSSFNPEEIPKILSKINATYGKFAVIGNHEYALSKKYSYENLMNTAGFKVLINDWLDIPEINVRLLGLDDAYIGNPNKDLSNQALDGVYNIMITHEPDIVDQMAIANVQLILAGHTHGGQISIPFLTEFFLPPGGKKYIKGLYLLGSNKETDLFVTKGVGMTTLPFRFMNLPEIVCIDINQNTVN